MSRKWLVTIRENSEKSQEFVADQAGISRQYYGMIESGVRNPSVDVAKAIAKTLNFDWPIFFELKSNVSLR